VRTLLILFVSLSAAGCSEVGTEALLDETDSFRALVLESGTSFGFCVGYCRTVLVVDSPRVTLTEIHMQYLTPTGAQPDRTRSITLSSSEWSELRASLDVAALKRLAGVHGCPDCADGGAEWIEVQTTGGLVRVTFEYGDVLDGIAPLQAEIRALRARFPR
jgi:hypothetical protein